MTPTIHKPSNPNLKPELTFLGLNPVQQFPSCICAWIKISSLHYQELVFIHTKLIITGDFLTSFHLIRTTFTKTCHIYTKVLGSAFERNHICFSVLRPESRVSINRTHQFGSINRHIRNQR